MPTEQNNILGWHESLEKGTKEEQVRRQEQEKFMKSESEAARTLNPEGATLGDIHDNLRRLSGLSSRMDLAHGGGVHL